jgi:hypothetical protein
MIPLPSLTGGRSREHSRLAKASVENIILLSTEVMHNLSEDLLNVENCDDPGCYIKNLTYFSGIDEKVIELSQLDNTSPLLDGREK